jgi:transposase
MARLESVSTNDLRSALAEVERKRPTQRLMVAIAYKHGTTQTELSEWYDVERKTVYNWLTRIEQRPDDIVEAVRDRTRPGRPRKLDDDQLSQLETTLQRRPTETGYDAPAWTPALLRRHIAETFDSDYSVASCRRLLREAGLCYRTSRELDTDDGREHCPEFEQSEGGWIGESWQLTDS